MSIFPNYFSVYERLRSSKMNVFASDINSHDHNGTYGVTIPFSRLADYILAVQIQDGTITGAMIQSSSISSSHIVDGTIVVDDINTSSVHLEPGTGYAYYRP